MSMWLILAKIEVDLLEAVRADPQLLDNILFDVGPVPGFDAESDRFGAGETESLDYDDLTYGPAFALGPSEVSDVAAGLVAEGWHAGSVVIPPSDETDEAAVQRSAQALGQAAEWDPDEIEDYGPMMAATGPSAFNVKVVQAIGATAGWDTDTVARVAAAVATAEPDELALDDDGDLAVFFLKAAAQGRAIVGGIN